MNKKSINRNTKISGTSNLTINDLVDIVAEELPNNPCRGQIEKIVKETVRPCAIGGVPTVVAGVGTVRGITGVTGCGCGPKIDINVHCGDSVGSCGGSSAESSCPEADDEGDMLMKRVDGGTMKVNFRTAEKPIGENSKWFGIVLQNGEVWTPYTSRRFLPAQYLSLMLQYDGNIDAAIACRYSLRDCFRLMDTEIEKLIFMSRHWRTAYSERCKFLTVEDCKEIFLQYLNGLKANINDRSKCMLGKRSGEYCRKIQGEGRVVLWKVKENHDEGPNGAVSDSTEILPTDWLVNLNNAISDGLRRVSSIKSYDDALNFLRNRIPRVSMGTFKDAEGRIRYWIPKAWKETFKKQGAYYTLKALIVNRHVRYATESGDWRRKTTESCKNARDGLNKLVELSDKNVPAYVVHAILKKSIEMSKLDIAKLLRQVCKR